MPLLKNIHYSSTIFKNQLNNTFQTSAVISRDLTLFTVGGLTLDAYILTLPLKPSIKARVIAQISNPTYAIPLGYFLYNNYQQYNSNNLPPSFEHYLTTIYSPQQLNQFQHSLYDSPFQLQQTEQKEREEKEPRLIEPIETDAQLAAIFVTLYDQLFEINDWRSQGKVPELYQYLTNSSEDQNTVTNITPTVKALLTEVASSINNNKIKQKLTNIADHNPQMLESITITLIDFVRLNTLKSYRQFTQLQQREDKLAIWLKAQLADNPQQIIDFLATEQNKPFAVQITVDGLQQGLISALALHDSQQYTSLQNASLQNTERQHQNKQRLKHFTLPITDANNMSAPKNSESLTRKHTISFIQQLIEQRYQDPAYLPFFKQLYTNHHSTIAQIGIASTPTISVRNLPIIKTGASVSGLSGTGIPNFHFVDRKNQRTYYFFGNDALQLDRLMAKNHVQTMFDRLSHLKTLNCHAQYDWNAQQSFDALLNLGLGETERDFGERRCVRELQNRSKIEQQLKQLRPKLISQIKELQSISQWRFLQRQLLKTKLKQNLDHYAQLDIQGMPDYTLIYNPWPDHFAHFTGPFSNEITMPTGELNRLDYWLQQIEDSYKQAGIYPQTLWGMAGDHGLTPVFYSLNPEKQIAKTWQQKYSWPLKIKKISADEGEGPKINPPLASISFNKSDMIVASTAGGNFMIDLFSSSRGIQQQPLYRELTQWQPKLTHQADDPLDAVDLIALIYQSLSDSLEYMVLREQDCSVDACTVRLIGSNDQYQRWDEEIIKQGDKRFYGVISKQTHLSEPILLKLTEINPYIILTAQQLSERNQLLNQCLYQADKYDPKSWCDSATWQRLTAYSAKPDSVNQLANLYNEPKAGTINLFPKNGIGYNTQVIGRHAGESYFEKDAFIGFWGAPIIPKTTVSTQNISKRSLLYAENGALAPTLYQYLTEEEAVKGKNGWGYSSLLPELSPNYVKMTIPKIIGVASRRQISENP
nr:alkaline phosphatase family protein [Vibrio sp. SS-MA-C1-2]